MRRMDKEWLPGYEPALPPLSPTLKALRAMPHWLKRHEAESQVGEGVSIRCAEIYLV